MQVHNHEASQTLFAYNNWGSNTGTSDTGIGNNPNAGATGVGGPQAPDWTFTANAPSFTTRNLYVLARPAPLVPTGLAPQLLSQPASRIVNQGAATTLAVSVNGAGPFTYQWRRNGEAIAGATDAWLDLEGFGPAQAGNYDVVVTSAGGVSTTSHAAAVSLANSLPLFSGFAFTVGRNETASLSSAQLLTKASDPDGHTLSITGVSAASAQGGTVALQAGNVLYMPAVGFLGTDSFTVTIADSLGASISGTVNATVTSAALNPAGGATVARRADGKLDLLFRGTPGQSTVVERSVDLTAWTPLQAITPGDDGFIPFTDANPPTEQAFYRSRPANP